MKGTIMPSPLIEELEKATDDEIKVASKKMAKLLAVKIVIGVVASVIVHFASEAIVGAIETRKENAETTEE